MKTNVVMKRPFMSNQVVSQRSDNEFLSLTDLERAGNKQRAIEGLPVFRTQEYLRTKQTKEFIKELESRYNVVKMSTRGRSAHVWAHPLLFIDMALSMSPKMKVEAYDWMKDNLIKYRNDSGDSYKNMCGAIITRLSNKSNFRQYVKKVAIIIRIACKVKSWETATEDQLKLRDRIQDVITLYTKVLTNPNECIRLAINEVIPRASYDKILLESKEEFKLKK